MPRSILTLAALVYATAAQGAVFTVGPHGAYATLQEGLSAAAVLAGSHEVRVEGGIHDDPVGVYDCCAGRVVVSGGWNDTFTSPAGGAATVLDGLGVRRVMELFVLRGELSLRNLTIRNGYVETIPHATASTFGAGLDARVRGDATLELSSLTFLSNRIHAAIPDASSAIGAGAALDVFERGQLRMFTTVFRGNAITEGPGADLIAGYGAGAWLSLRGKAIADVRRNTFRQNRLEGDGYVGAAGLHLSSRTVESVAQVRENTFDRNEVVVALEDPAASGMTAVAVSATTAVVIEARRNRFVGNRGGPQLRLYAYGGARIVAGDSLLAAGTHEGVVADGRGGSRTHLVNLTSVGNAGAGVRASGEGSVFNTIAFENAPDTVLAAAVAAGFNLVGVDPLFAPGSGYRLSAASPARDAGTNAPPGGLGPLDVDLGPRVVGPRVDVGAHEYKP
jgi:hypothetical protein